MKTILAALAAMALTALSPASADGLIENDPSLPVSGFSAADTSIPAEAEFTIGNRGEQRHGSDVRLFASEIAPGQGGENTRDSRYRDPSGGWLGFQQ